MLTVLLIPLSGLLLYIALGIVGMRLYYKPEKAVACIVLAIIAIALHAIPTVLIAIISIETQTFGWLWLMLFCLLLLVLYLIGAVKNKKVDFSLWTAE